MKVKQIWESRTSLGKLLNDDGLDTALAWRLKGLAKELRELEGAYFKLLQKFGKPQNDGQTYKVVDLLQFQEELEGLLGEDFGIEIKPIKFSECGCKLSAMDLVSLDWLIVSDDS